MKRFASLWSAIDATTSTLKKRAALVSYLRDAPPTDAAWAVYFLAGGKPAQAIPTRLMRELACEIGGVDSWLFDECHAVTGDLAEAIAYVMPPAERTSDRPLAEWIEQCILPLRGAPDAVQREALREAWAQLDRLERFIFVKLVGGGFRVGVGRLLVQQALAEVAGLDAKLLAHRMIGYTDRRTRPTAEHYLALIDADDAAALAPSQPYPFFLAHPLTVEPHQLPGTIDDWLIEWKYDGIRAQVVRRAGQTHVWSRGEDMLTDRMPELIDMAASWPDGTVVDGEILAWRTDGDDRHAAFAVLQQRIGRLKPSKAFLQKAPVAFVAYDLLEIDGADLRATPLHERRRRLEQFAVLHGVRLSPLVKAADWDQLTTERQRSREMAVEGLMLKHRDSTYGTGRTRGNGIWWKWKVEPYTVDAVLIYAQAGHGRRANVFTDYTFAVWNRPPRDATEAQAVIDAIRDRRPADRDGLQLVPFAKAYSGLSDAEFKEVDREIRRHVIDKFGPVRAVVPTMMFELGFEGIQRSSRHKSGIGTRFPRMLRTRFDKPLHEADSLQTLEALVDGGSIPRSPHRAPG